MEKSNFDRLLERYLNGQVTDEERTKIEAWLDSRKGNVDRNFIWSETEEENIFRKITDKIDQIEEGASNRPDPKTGSRGGWRVYAVAASVLFLAVLSYGVWITVSKSGAVENRLISGEYVKKLILRDGSLVWLKDKSNITYSENDATGERFASFSGEALFEIAKDPARPFVVTCGDVKAKVLGTSFTIRTLNEGIDLKVLTGRVKISSSHSDKVVEVIRNEQVRYTRRGANAVVALSGSEADELVTSSEYNMRFKNTSMDQVFKKIGKKFDADLSIGNQKLLFCRITADFTDRSLDDTMMMLSELLEIEYNIKGKSVVIRGQGCN